MLANYPALQDSGVAKIKALLAEARPRLVAGAKALGAEMKHPLQADQNLPSSRPSITGLADEVKALRTSVMATTVQGAVAVNAKDLTARALLESEQALTALAESYGGDDQTATTKSLAESVRLLKAAKVSGTAAGKALGIRWPLL